MEILKHHDYYCAFLKAKDFLRGAEPKRIYSKWDEDLEDFRMRLPPDPIYQLKWDFRGIRGKGRWLVEEIL